MTDLPQSQSLGSRAMDSSVKYCLDLHKGLLSIIFHLRQTKNPFKDFFFSPMDETSLNQKMGCWASEFLSCGEMTLIHIYWWEVWGGPVVWLLSSLREVWWICPRLVLTADLHPLHVLQLGKCLRCVSKIGSSLELDHLCVYKVPCKIGHHPWMVLPYYKSIAIVLFNTVICNSCHLIIDSIAVLA